MTNEDFLSLLREHTDDFAKAVATDEGDWIVKGFIDVFRRVYTVSVDTKIVSKVLELLLIPMLGDFGEQHGFRLELAPHQNFYPDISFRHTASDRLFAVDVKSTYRVDDDKVNGMTLGAFTGYFRNRDSSKNTLHPYGAYVGHNVLGVVYSRCTEVIDEHRTFTVDDIKSIPSVIRDFHFFVQPKYRIASTTPGSGNTKNIGSVTRIDELLIGIGPFADLGEDVYDDYWTYYLTRDMAKKDDIKRPYTNMKTYLEYKKRGTSVLIAHEAEIIALDEETEGEDE